MADLIFGLLHTEDTLTLRVAGIMIDPFHPVPPLSFRMGFMLKHILISDDDPGLSRSLLTHVWRSCDVDPTTSNDRQLEDALIQLLYCDKPTAKDLVTNTKKPVKISLKLNSSKAFAKPPPIRPTPAPQPSTSATSRQRKVVFKDDYEEPEEPPYTPTRTTRRGRVIKSEFRDDDDKEYKPKKKMPQPQHSPRQVRGTYKKSQKQKEKELAAAKRNARLEKRSSAKNVTIFRPPAVAVPSTSTFDPLDTSNSDFDPLDPLAMNEDPLIDGVSIKTELIDDDNPPIIQNDISGGESMDGIENPLGEPATITDDPVITDEPIEEDVSNLLISSVTSVNNLDELGMSSPAQSTSSLDIQADPLLENSAEENSITSDIPEQEKARQSGEVEVTNPTNSEPNESVISNEKENGNDVNDTEASQESQEVESNDPSSVTENESTPQEPLEESSVSLEQDPMELDQERSNLQTNEDTLDDDNSVPQEPLDQDPMELDTERSNLQTNLDDNKSVPQESLEDHMELEKDNPNLLSEEANSVSSINGLTSDDPLAARAAVSEDSVENGIENDPFNQDDFPGEDLENSINDLLQSNPLENGSSEEPTLLDDDDANDLLDQLVDFQAGKSISEGDNKNSESATSQ